MNLYTPPTTAAVPGWGTNSSATTAAPQIVPSFSAVLSRMLSFETVLTLLETIPGDINYLTIDQISILSLQAINHIKNRYTVRYVVEVELDADASADLPDNCDKIDAVLPGGFDPVLVSVATSVGEMTVAASQLYGRQGTGSGYMSFAKQPIPAWGKPLDCAMISTDGAARVQLATGTRGRVRIVYRARLCDSRGWPLVTPMEAEACAWYALWIETGKRFWRKEASRELYQSAEEGWSMRLTSARNEGMGDKSGFQRLLDERVRDHRHSFGSPVQIQ